MSPFDGGMILGGSIMVALIGYGILRDWQEHREAEAARHALAYYDTWADADLIRDDDDCDPVAFRERYADDDDVVLHNQPTKDVR